MSYIQVLVEQMMTARPEQVYAALADYREQHPRILPPNFLDYTVEAGGQGAGTIIRYRLRVANREHAYRLRVEEPTPGKVLIERDTRSSLVTIWAIIPVEDGRQTRVRLTTRWEGASGPCGWFERCFAPLGLRRLYTDLLRRLAQAVESPLGAIA